MTGLQALLLAFACSPSQSPAPPPPAALPGAAAAPASPASPLRELFLDQAAEAGLAFVHVNGMTGEHYFHEMMGAGVALFDFDRDQDLDVYLVQGHALGRAAGEPAADPPTGRLFRNDFEVGPGGQRRLAFTDVTEASGIRATGYGMGVATGDVDGDGWTDLYLSNFEANQLWRNRGDGTFEDATARAGVGDRRWSVPALFADFDRDGDQDLYVGNYVDFTLATHKRCTTDLGGPNYCGPLAFRPYPDSFYRNRGDGTFEEASARLGLGGAHGGALGAVAGDFDGDGWLDLYVGNDGLPNQLWINRQGKGFTEEALLAGAAVNGEGEPEASMGIDAADFDGDGDEDLFLTHLTRETNTLYVNGGGAVFTDRSVPSGLGPPSFAMTGFGTAFLDAENDGDLDLLVVNGAVRVIEELARAGDPFPLHQPNQLFLNRGDGTFEDASARAGAAFALSEVSRGAAFGDVDNDGDTDVVVTQNNGPVRLLVNQAGQDLPWLGLELRDRAGGPALGAWVELQSAAGTPVAFRRVRSAVGYASASDPRLHFGLGPSPPPGPYRALVRWPHGSSELFRDLEPGRYTALAPGGGEAVEEGR